MSKTIEFWYDFGSNYSYLSVMRIGPLAAQLGVQVVWRPFLLGPIFQSFGWETSPFVLQKEKGEYVWKDMERQAEKFSLPFKRPTVFPRTAILATRVALLGAEQPWCEAFSQRIMQRNFADDREIGDADLVTAVLEELGLAVPDVLAAAQSETNKLALRNQVEQARANGLFGAPSFTVGSELFWGNDRLEDALYCAAGQTAPSITTVAPLI
jgi:2-hydroxychromene-2-carboxylate isomerase